MDRRMQIICGLCLFLCSLTVTAHPWQYELDEGQDCRMEDKSAGVCTKITQCPSRLHEVYLGTRTEKGRCGFDGDIEIVCCQQSKVAGKIIDSARPAERACADFKNEVSLTSLSFHILNGVEANESEIPQIAALGYHKPTEENPGRIQYDCGGTLISEQHVLTAAHCVTNLDGVVPVEVMLGSVDLTRTDETVQRVNISRTIPHPEYRHSRNYHDIAIVVLIRAVKFSIAVQPACLQARSVSTLQETVLNVTLVVAGWGSTDFAEDGSPRLMKASGLEIVDRKVCSRSYSTWQARLPNGLDDTLLCAIDSNTERRADTCQGDSGGPLFYSVGNDSVVVGVTSFGQTCGTTVPSIYTSVFGYLDWIESEVWP